MSISSRSEAGIVTVSKTALHLFDWIPPVGYVVPERSLDVLNVTLHPATPHRDLIILFIRSVKRWIEDPERATALGVTVQIATTPLN